MTEHNSYDRKVQLIHGLLASEAHLPTSHSLLEVTQCTQEAEHGDCMSAFNNEATVY